MAKQTKAPYFTQLGLARKAGVGKSTISEAIRRGSLAVVWTLDGVAPLIEVAEAARWMTDRKPGPKPGAKPKGGK